jgi:hypothetical protein
MTNDDGFPLRGTDGAWPAQSRIPMHHQCAVRIPVRPKNVSAQARQQTTAYHLALWGGQVTVYEET